MITCSAGLANGAHLESLRAEDGDILSKTDLSRTDLSMPTIIYVTHFDPSEDGNGGNHRAYQILQDLDRSVGRDNVVVVNQPEWLQRQASQTARTTGGIQVGDKLRQSLPPNHIARRIWRAILEPARRTRRAKQKLMRGMENPWRVMLDAPFSIKSYSSPSMLSYYNTLARSVTKPAACIIAHVGFADLVHVNNECGIPTIACIQNLESFDTSGLDLARKAELYATVIDFANELAVLQSCTERLFISKVETGVVGGLGLPSRYYPYLPVGAIRDRLLATRLKRERTTRRNGLFLLLGSAAHTTTRRAFEWFVSQVQAFGLPKNTHVVVGGLGTDTLLPHGALLPGVELRGRLDQAELDELIVSVEAVLLPQFQGFGALTRLAEMSCAGVPGLTSSHPAFAVDLPPGIDVVEGSWQAWTNKMQEVHDGAIATATHIDLYLGWERKQPRSLDIALADMGFLLQ